MFWGRHPRIGSPLQSALPVCPKAQGVHHKKIFVHPAKSTQKLREIRKYSYTQDLSGEPLAKAKGNWSSIILITVLKISK
jgi:hypothetical protein